MAQMTKNNNHDSEAKKEIIANQSGEYYDYTKTYAPERPYIIAYDKTLTMKMYLAQPDGKGGSEVFINFEQALQNIIQVDNITRGIPKIVCMVSESNW